MAGRVNGEVCALDASVGVKWFRDEAGSDRARALLQRHIDGEILISVDTLFYYEVVRAASRAEALTAPSAFGVTSLTSIS